MNIFRNNVMYVVLALLALILIGITVGLQIVIMSRPDPLPAADANTPDASIIAADNSQDNAVVLAPTSTNTPLVIVVQPTVLPQAPVQEEPNVDASSNLPVAAQSASEAVDPVRLMIDAENVTSSPDDDVRMTVLANDPLAIGVFSHAYYAQHSESTRAVKIQLNGGSIVEPSPESTLHGTYPLARPLYLYSTATEIRQKPQVEAFLGCFLNHINSEIVPAGYFPIAQSLLSTSISQFEQHCTFCRKDGALPACTLDSIPTDSIDISSSTAFLPVTQRMIDLFMSAGFVGNVDVSSGSAGTDFARFCEEGLSDIVSIDRSILESELAACRAINREPIAFPIGVDPMTLVVSKANTFVDSVTLPELQALFSTATTWSDIRAEWPVEPIKRIIPGTQSGALDFLANRLYTSAGEQAFMSAANALTLAPPPAVTAPEALPQANPTQVPPTQVLVEPTPTLPPAPTPPPAPTDPLLPSLAHAEGENGENDLPFDFVLTWVPDRPDCLITTQIVQKVIHQNFDLKFFTEQYNDPDEMYASFKNRDDKSLQQLTLCYTDPLDRKYLPELVSWMSFVNNGYWQNGAQRWFVAVHTHVLGELPAVEPCLMQFFKQLDFGDEPLDPPDVDGWLAAHPDRVEAWLQCK